MTEEEIQIDLQQIEDERSLLAVIGLMTLELSKMHPNDALLGKEVRQLIKKYNVEK